MLKSDAIERPAHYTFSAVEPIEAIEAWQLGYHLGNVVKYVARAEHKGAKLNDLRKAAWYLRREIERLEGATAGRIEQPSDDGDSPAVCPTCSGTGTSRCSHRPDDYGPHVICDACGGTGIARQD